MPTHYKTLVESDWLGQWDFPTGREAVVVIESVKPYTPEKRQKKKMPDGSYKDEPNKRVAIAFRGKKKAWLAGPVSQKAIAGMFGPYLENWIGKAITLYVDTDVMFGKQKTGGVRVRPTPPKIGTKATEDALDRPVDPAKAQQIADAKAETGREPGED